MTRAKDISKIITDADFSGTLDVTGTVTAGGLTVDGDTTLGGAGDTVLFQTNSNLSPTYFSRSTVTDQSLSIGVDDNDVFLNSIQDEQYGGFEFQSTFNGIGTQNRLSIANNGDISFYEDTGTTPKLFWDASAERLGVGTASPSHELTVAGSTDTRVTIDGSNSAGLYISDSGANGITIRNTNDGDLEFLTVGGKEVVFNQLSVDTDFRVESDNNTHALFVQGSDGNVGIGTSSPDTMLHLNEASTSSVQFKMENTDGTYIISANNRVVFHDAETQVFRNEDASTEYARYDSSGNLLVGTTNVNPAQTTSAGVRISSINSQFSVSNDPVVYINRTTSDGDIAVFRKDGTTVGTIGNTSGQSYFYIVNDGGCGIAFGNTNAFPANGTGALSDNTKDLGGGATRWDDIYATNGTIQTSDQNEKNTITDSDLGIDFIKRLTPKSYIFNGKTRTHYGLIAQDVETVLSDINKPTSGFAGFIKTDISEEQDGSEYRYGLRYTEFVAPLIQAVKDQQATIDALTARITALENGV